MDGFLSHAETAHADARRSTGTYLDVEYVHLATPDRTVHVFSAYPAPDLHVRSNSLVALRRVLEAIRGKGPKGQPVRRLGDTAEYAYIRTLLPRGAPEESGLVYLSDPFIRRLVGPQVKLTERRRMLCYNHLRMIGHAALLYRTEHGRAPDNLEQLVSARCAPGRFGEQNGLTCPDGGKYSLAPDGLTGVCSHHSHAHDLTPCCEIPVKEVTGDEAEQYRGFLQDYNQYWRTYFDPIALRIQVAPERYRLETIVLPLIDNSIYTGLARVLGGKPEPLDALPVPKRNIFSVALRIKKPEIPKQPDLVQHVQCANNLKMIGLALHNYHDAWNTFPAAAIFDKQDKPLLSWRVHLLPFLEQDRLYTEFHLDEPWDSEHNKKLIARMPAVYRCPSLRVKEAGKTTYLAPVYRGKPGEATMFSGDKQPVRIVDARDGSSNTIFIVDADDAHAVTWTKPDDLAYDPRHPRAGLVGHHPDSIQALFVDGSVHRLRATLDPNTVRALFTRAGGEVVALAPGDDLSDQSPTVGDWFGLLRELHGTGVESLHVEEFVLKGLGDQVGLHVYDAAPLFDFNLPAALGLMVGSFNGTPRRSNELEELPIAFLIASLNAPVYISLPVQDAKVVDDFLGRLDRLAAVHARRGENIGGFVRLQPDFYKLSGARGQEVRSLGIQFGPVKWRLFWARIGNGLYIASKKFILDDLQEIHAKGASGDDAGPPAHAMLRLRPENWDQVLADFRLGWAENNRLACLNNVGPLSSIARAVRAKNPGGHEEPVGLEIQPLADRVHAVHFFCPDGGRYERTPDGKSVVCSIHGSARAPRQPAAPAAQSAPGQLQRHFKGMTVTLTFVEDGLHAVVTIDRK
jgi:hypothetical protein